MVALSAEHVPRKGKRTGVEDRKGYHFQRAMCCQLAAGNTSLIKETMWDIHAKCGRRRYLAWVCKRSSM